MSESTHMTRTLLSLFLLFMVTTSRAQSPSIRIEQVMTVEEFQESGVSSLSPRQKDILNHWLMTYTTRVIAAARQVSQPATPATRTATTSCSTVIESSLSGEFNGWDGDTIFKLDNGQIWQQAEYDYTYSYAYRPDVMIYPTAGGCKMKVEDEDDVILVKRLK